MSNKEMKSSKEKKNPAPQAARANEKNGSKNDAVESLKASDTQSEFNVNERRQQQSKEQ